VPKATTKEQPDANLGNAGKGLKQRQRAKVEEPGNKEQKAVFKRHSPKYLS
jgi:hypothetical protein